ncbi:MAG: GNVR domain-containing protein [bacterium]
MTPELTLHDYWRVIKRRRWAVLLAFSGTLFSTAFYTRLQPTVYRSQAMVRIQPPPSYSKIPGADVTTWDPWGMVATEIRIIQSVDIAEKAARHLGWITEASSPEDIHKASARTAASYKPAREEGSNLITISASAENPLLAADIVNAVVEAYMAHDLEERSRQAKKTLEDVAARKNEVEESLRSIERARQNFLEQNPGTGLGSALSSQLIDLETKRKNLLEKYTQNHPNVIEMDQRIQTIQSKLGELPAQETELVRLTRELRINESLYTTLNRQYEEAKIVLASVVSFVSVVSRAVPPEAPVSPVKWLNFTMGSILGLFLGIALAFFLENLDVSISTIEEIERLTELPVLGVIPHMHSPKYMENWLMDIFKKPRYNMDSFRQVLVFTHSSKSPVIESYHSLRSNIASHLGSKESSVLVFSSAGSAEGKTLTAVNFAISAAHAGLRVLLVDADMRRPSLHDIFGLRRQPGFSDILSGAAKWEDTLTSSSDFIMGEFNPDHLIRFPGIDNMKIIPAGMPVPNVVNTLDSGLWKDLERAWRESFDLVILDCTPVLLFVDSVIVSRHADGVVLVYKAGKMARGALRRAKEQVVAGRANMIGIVLNGMKTSEIGPYYGYYYDYGQYSQPDELKKPNG